MYRQIRRHRLRRLKLRSPDIEASKLSYAPVRCSDGSLGHTVKDQRRRALTSVVIDWCGDVNLRRGIIQVDGRHLGIHCQHRHIFSPDPVLHWGLNFAVDGRVALFGVTHSKL